MSKETLFWPSVKKCLVQDSQPTIDEFSNFSLLFKQAIGLVIGVVIAILGIKGWMGFGIFFIFNAVLSLVYAKNYLGIDEEDIENFKIITEGLMTGFVVFLLTWILTYTCLNFN
jgi:hypothetical protein